MDIRLASLRWGGAPKRLALKYISKRVPESERALRSGWDVLARRCSQLAVCIPDRIDGAPNLLNHHHHHHHHHHHDLTEHRQGNTISKRSYSVSCPLSFSFFLTLPAAARPAPPRTES